MNKSQRLMELLRYVNMKKEFTAQEAANEFNISIRTVHRYLLELSDLGVYFYTVQGKYGGYRLISSRILPPVNFTEDEALSIFFAFQSLADYSDLPFEVDINSVSRKIYTNLPSELQNTVDRMKSVLAFKNTHRNISNRHLKQLLLLAGSKKKIQIEYKSTFQTKIYIIIPVCVYCNSGFWYAPSYDTASAEIKHFRVDRVISLLEIKEEITEINLSLEDCFHYHISKPLRLYVKLDTYGIRECQSSPYFGKSIVINEEDDNGYIDETMDEKDIKYLGDFFLRLGKSAHVLEPLEIRNYIINKANELINIYNKQ